MNPSMKTLTFDSSDIDLRSLDEAAFERLYRDHLAQVQGVVRRYLWGTVVDDVVQETFAQAYRSGLHLEAHPRQEAWVAKRLSGIARNRSIDVLRFRMRGLEEVSDDGRLLAGVVTTDDQDPHRQLQAARRRDGITEALEGVCGRQRRMLVLHYVDGRSYEEIAEIEGMSLEAVRSTLARGRRAFRDLYATIADRKGLSVVLGGLVGRLQGRLREARDRLVSGAGNVAGAVTAATPAVSNGLVAAMVVGGIAAGAMVSTVAPAQALQPTSRTEAPPADDGAQPQGNEATPQERAPDPDPAPERQPEPAAEPQPEPEPRAEPDRRRGAPAAARAEVATETKIDSEEAAPVDDAPARSNAEASADAEADTEEGIVKQGASGKGETLSATTEGQVEAAEHARVGCMESDFDDPISEASSTAVCTLPNAGAQ